MSNIVERIVKGLRLRNGLWHIDKMIKGHKIYKSTGTSDYETACKILDKEIQVLNIRVAEKSWADMIEHMAEDGTSWLHRTHRKMVLRGARSGKGCSISLLQFKAIVASTNGYCQLTSIRFSQEKPVGSKTAPFGMSIDRIDSKQGYHSENCRIVCLAVNLAMKEWGHEVLVRIGKAMLLKELEVSVRGDAELKTGKSSAKNTEDKPAIDQCCIALIDK